MALAGTRRRVVEMGEDRHQLRLAGERDLSDHASVEHTSEGVDVGPAVHVGLAADHLRSHVVDRARERSRSRQARGRRDVLRDAEVRQERTSEAALTTLEQDVRRADAAVNEPFRVRGVERRGGLGDDGDRDRRIEAAFGLEQPFQVRPFDVSHGHVEESFGLSRVVDRDDVGVLESGDDARLTDEALSEGRVLRERRVQDLQRHLAAQTEMVGDVDDRHPTAADDGLDPIARKLGAHPRIGLHALVLTSDVIRG